jgi:hypothetical protein
MKNMIKKFRYILWGLLLIPFVTTTSCFKDEGNYTYVEVSRIEIDTIGRSAFWQLTSNANIGDTLRFKPVINYDKDPSRLEFVWFIYPFPYREVQDGAAMVFPRPDTVSRSHELFWIVNVEPGDYDLQLIVTDPETGKTASLTMPYRVNVPRQGVRRGLFILSEYDGQTDIDLYGSRLGLTALGGDHFTPRYYSSLYDGRMIPGKPRFISSSRPNPVVFNEQVYYVFTDETGLRLNQEGLQTMDDFNAMFYTVPTFNPQAFLNTNQAEFLINDGNLHVLYNNRTNDRKFSPHIAGNYRAGSFLQRSTRGSESAVNADQIIFDEQTNSFRPYFPMASSISQFNTTRPGAVLDANNLGNKPIAIFELSDGTMTACIMRINGRDSLFVFNFRTRADEGDLSNLAVNARRSLEGAVGISEAKFFASSNAGSAFFYATTSAVYGYSVTGGLTSNFIYQVGSGEEVTALFQMIDGGFPTRGCILWIGVWNNSTKQGKLVEFEIDPATGVPRIFHINEYAPGQPNPHITEGFGKIKSMTVAM